MVGRYVTKQFLVARAESLGSVVGVGGCALLVARDIWQDVSEDRVEIEVTATRPGRGC